MPQVQVFEGDGKMTPEWEAVRDENEVLKKKIFQAEWDADQLKRRVEELIKERDDKRRETIKSLDELNSIIMNQKATIKDLLEQRDAAENKINDVHLALSGLSSRRRYALANILMTMTIAPTTTPTRLMNLTKMTRRDHVRGPSLDLCSPYIRYSHDHKTHSIDPS